MTTVLITGATRGIGLELARLYVERGHAVIATCREPSPALEALNANIFDKIDVTDEAALRDLAAELGGVRIDVLINNAGILKNDTLDDFDADSIRRQFEVNALGPLQVTKALINSLARGSKVAILTSVMASMAGNTKGGYYGYRMSKAALNMVGVNLALDLRARGVAVALIHPGMVATRMTGEQGLPPSEAAANVAGRIDALTLETSGRFFYLDGEPVPW